jgi:hypothetical protein
MKKLGLLALAVVAAGALATSSAHAVTGDPCTDGGSGLGTGQHPIGDGNTGTIYIDDRDYATGNGLWLYLESNNVFNLQRGGTAPVDPIGIALGEPDTDPCYDGGTPDTLIF